MSSRAQVVSVVHVAGPWEDEWLGGEPVRVMRCLRCDELLTTQSGKSGEGKPHPWHVGSRVGIISPGGRMYDADAVSEVGVEQGDCRG